MVLKKELRGMHVYDIPAFQSLLLMLFAPFCEVYNVFKLSTLFSHSVEFLYFEEREEWLLAVVRLRGHKLNCHTDYSMSRSKV